MHSDAVIVTALREFTISNCALVTFQHQVDDVMIIIIMMSKIQRMMVMWLMIMMSLEIT